MRISGGIGNQLFQYALGRNLALKNNTSLLLDTSSYLHQNSAEAQRDYTLARFNIQGHIATAQDFAQVGIEDPDKQDLLAKLARKFRQWSESARPINERKVVIEPSFSFDPGILAIQKDSFLIGVWQSEHYFIEHARQVREDLTLREPLSLQAEELARRMRSSNSVAIHVRRGDQVSDPHLLKKHGHLGEDYYQASIAYIRDTVLEPEFFVFSDEIEWVKENLPFSQEVTYVSSYNLADYEEIILMSLCKHAITAKSSYSWWGAWLNSNPKKIVIAPKKRFGTETIDDSDLVPSSWIRL